MAGPADPSRLRLLGSYAAKQCPVRAQWHVIQPAATADDPVELTIRASRGVEFEDDIVGQLKEVDPQSRVSHLPERFAESLEVVGGSLSDAVDVSGRSGCAPQDGGAAADEDELDAVVVERFEDQCLVELTELVGAHVTSSPSSRSSVR